jgi:hypothetical protein
MKKVEAYWIYRMRGPYPSRRRRAADGEEGRGPGGVGKEDGERRGGGFERKEGEASVQRSGAVWERQGPCMIISRSAWYAEDFLW